MLVVALVTRLGALRPAERRRFHKYGSHAQCNCELPPGQPSRSSVLQCLNRAARSTGRYIRSSPTLRAANVLFPSAMRVGQFRWQQSQDTSFTVRSTSSSTALMSKEHTAQGITSKEANRAARSAPGLADVHEKPVHTGPSAIVPLGVQEPQGQQGDEGNHPAG